MPAGDTACHPVNLVLLRHRRHARADIQFATRNDSGSGSLRQAILDASSGDTINFAPSVTTVTLTSGELVIDKNLTITGPGANRLTVQVDRSRHSCSSFQHQLEYGNCFYLRDHDLKWRNAEHGPGGGGILSAGVLTLTDCTISDNFVGDQFGGHWEGGVMNDNGTMIITGCTISNNSEGEGEGGGGVLNENGTMTITGCTD